MLHTVVLIPKKEDIEKIHNISQKYLNIKDNKYDDTTLYITLAQRDTNDLLKPKGIDFTLCNNQYA